MVALTPSLFLAVVSAGAAGVGFLSIIAGIVGFSDPSWYHEGQIGVEFAMKADTLAQEVWVWIRAPWPMHIHTAITDIIKIEENGDEKNAHLTDMLPVGGVTHGTGQVSFEMFSVPDSVMPDLRNRNQEIAPQAFIHPFSKFPEFLRYMMVANAVMLNNWGLVQFGVIAYSVMLILGGSFLIVVSLLTNKEDKNAVQDLRKIKTEKKDEEDDD